MDWKSAEEWIQEIEDYREIAYGFEKRHSSTLWAMNSMWEGGN